MKKKLVMKEMDDEQMYQVLQDFANQHTLAQDMIVNISSGGRGMKAKDMENPKANYEDACLLMDLLRGAEHFLLWARRKHIVRFSNVSTKSTK
jgi:hypothetical protein